MLSGSKSRWFRRCSRCFTKIPGGVGPCYQSGNADVPHKFLYQNSWELVHEGGQYIGSQWFHYSIIREKTNKLGFDLYLVDINGLLDREKIYGYDDDNERFVAFQVAVCDWLSKWQHNPDVIHCHDHHTGLIPFMVSTVMLSEINWELFPPFSLFTMGNTRDGSVGINIT